MKSLGVLIFGDSMYVGSKDECINLYVYVL